MIHLRPVVESDADLLFPLVFQTSVTDTLVWDGPDSLAEYRAALRLREEWTRSGKELIYTMLTDAGEAVGSIGIHPDPANHSAMMGLWIGVPFHGRGYGTEAVGQLVELGFEKMVFERLEARIYVGNMASRRVFERNGFQLEGTLRRVALKRGAFVSEWVMGIIREDYERTQAPSL